MDESELIDIASLIELRAMLVMSRTDPGMHDLLSQAKEYFVLKGKPSLEEAIRQQKDFENKYKETQAQRTHRLMNTIYGL
jgi:hypothetical protein